MSEDKKMGIILVVGGVLMVPAIAFVVAFLGPPFSYYAKRWEAHWAVEQCAAALEEGHE